MKKLQKLKQFVIQELESVKSSLEEGDLNTSEADSARGEKDALEWVLEEIELLMYS